MHQVFTRQVTSECSPNCQHCHRVAAVNAYSGSLESQPLYSQLEDVG